MTEQNVSRSDQNWANPSDFVQRARQDALVSEHFQSAASFWGDIYLQRDVHAAIHQLRRSLVFSLVSDLGLQPESPALDVGCGAGSISVELASRGLNVTALDRVPKMIDLTTQLAWRAGVGDRVTTRLGDIHQIPSPDKTFSLVLAIGVLPWLTSYESALLEIARVLKPGGHLVINIDNLWAIHRFLDPGMNLLIKPFKAPFARAIRRLLSTKAIPANTTISPKAFRAMIRSCGFEPSREVMFGFGPFSFFGYRYLPESWGIKLHRGLQALCDRGIPVVRSTGAQYLLVAERM
jgi:ubiquinone/menaquinone biosynthesis C-methylase UbiE